MKTIEVRTFTSFWELERKMYSFEDVKLPFPLALKSIAIFAAASVPWMPLIWLIWNGLGLSFASPWFLVVIAGPPAALAFFGAKPLDVFGRKTLIQFLRSQIRYVMEDKRHKNTYLPDLNKYGEPFEVESHLFLKSPKSLPFERQAQPEA